MPKIEIDYSNTIVYKIACNDHLITDVYVGITTNFIQRKYAHKLACNNIKSSCYNFKLYKTIRAHGNWSNWNMSIINYYNCKDLFEAKQKEQEHFIALNANLNSVEPLPQQQCIYTQPLEQVNISQPLLKKYSCTLVILPFPARLIACLIMVPLVVTSFLTTFRGLHFFHRSIKRERGTEHE